MPSICVYLGANPGNNPHFTDAAMLLGKAIADAGYRLIYGASSQGLMGKLATSALAHGGQVTGIIPEYLIEKEKPLTTLDELIITSNIQERKRLMEQRSDGFIVMPGGLGTFEEAFETWCAIKMGVLNKPIGFLNIDGFYNTLFLFIDHCVQAGFMTEAQAHIPTIEANPKTLLTNLMQQSALMETVI